MRAAFSRALIDLARADPSVLLLTGDHGYALFDEYRRCCPDQYMNAGVAEQNMVSMAAGLARVGFRPFVYALAAFVPVRTVEQIKLDITQDHLPVVLVGDGAGLVYSQLGPSHQSAEDIACTRALPGLTIFSPADRFEMRACMAYAGAATGPVYLRMGKADRGDVHPGAIGPLQPGGLLRIREGRADRPGLVATGSMVSTALGVAAAFDLSVWSAPVLKPLSVTDVCAAASASTGLVTLEEHSVLGGLGAAVAEITAEHQPTRVLRIGVPDRFSSRCGSHDYLLREHGLDIDTVRDRVAAFMALTERSDPSRPPWP